MKGRERRKVKVGSGERIYADEERKIKANRRSEGPVDMRFYSGLHKGSG